MAYNVRIANLRDCTADNLLVRLHQVPETSNIVISTRYALPVSLLLAFALLPTIIHSYIGVQSSDGLITAAISPTLGNLQSRPTDRRARWVQEVYDSVDWIERRYVGPDGTDLLLFVARSFDLKRLYHHPELGVLHRVDFKRPQTQSSPLLDGAPVHVLNSSVGLGVAAYALLYDGEFVAEPVLLQLRTSVELIFGARKPLTIFFVYDETLPSTTPFHKSTAARLLADAITSFDKQVPSPSTAKAKDGESET